MDKAVNETVRGTALLEAFKEQERAMKFCCEARCPAQVLVLDRQNGPADTIADLVSRLLEGQVSTMLTTNSEDALYALNCYEFDVVMIGVEENALDQLTLLPDLRADYPDLAVVVFGKNMQRNDLERCRFYSVNETVEMPRRAAELKSLVAGIASRFLECAC